MMWGNSGQNSVKPAAPLSSFCVILCVDTLRLRTLVRPETPERNKVLRQRRAFLHHGPVEGLTSDLMSSEQDNGTPRLTPGWTQLRCRSLQTSKVQDNNTHTDPMQHKENIPDACEQNEVLLSALEGVHAGHLDLGVKRRSKRARPLQVVHKVRPLPFIRGDDLGKQSRTREGGRATMKTFFLQNCRCISLSRAGLVGPVIQIYHEGTGVLVNPSQRHALNPSSTHPDLVWRDALLQEPGDAFFHSRSLRPVEVRRTARRDLLYSRGHEEEHGLRRHGPREVHLGSRFNVSGGLKREVLHFSPNTEEAKLDWT